MTIIFNEEDMIQFGEYLLSDKRKISYENDPRELDDEELAENLKRVHKSDIEAFISWKKRIA